MEKISPIRILILAHDLSDSAVERRAAMLQMGGAQVQIAGFRRTENPVQNIAGITPVDFGRTFNGGFAQRIYSILLKLFTLSRYRGLFSSTDMIIARNLEMLALGVKGRKMASPQATLVYECLDIHRLLLNQGLVGFMLRGLEGWLGTSVAGIITSSPAFVQNYLAKYSLKHLPVRFVENKVLVSDNLSPVPAIERPTAPPWVIGWFGIIRCRKSLGILSELVKQSGGKVQVVIRGKPALDQFDDFNRQTSSIPGLSFKGAYKNPDDLAAMYSGIHFTWAIDRYEEGQNSAWLLPNRIYEGGKFASIPLAEQNVETGRFLRKLGIGVTLNDPLLNELLAFFGALTTERYADLSKAAQNVPAATWSDDREACIKLVHDIAAWRTEGRV